jgi:ribosomal protein S21|tara:strand:- start:513 stop:740 length:228 start_codon:yes stop_codon:yes gene_type:complete
MIKIKVYDNNSVKAISKLKSILVNEGLFKELKSRKYYKKPSLKKRLKREEARKQRQRDFKQMLKSAERDQERGQF